MAEEELLLSLQLRGWYLKDITIVEELLQEVSTEKPSRAELEKMIEANLLEMDLKVVGGKCLPDAAAVHRISRLQGPKVLQIVSIRNIRQSGDRAMVPSQQKDGRLLQICLTDGHSTITAIEYCPLPSISEDMAPGTKVCFEGIASVKSGILLLESRSLNVLGGYVQSLYEEWEIERKYSIFSRSSLNSSQVQGSSGPPPFERLNIEISPVQSRHKAELQVHKSYGSQRVISQRDKPIASKLTNESTGTDFMEQGTASVKPGGKLPDTSTYQVKDNAGSLNNGSITTERVRTGYEVYRPKASQHKPVESLQLCAKSLEKASICSDKKTNLLPGNQKPKFSEPEIKSTDVKTNNMPVELRKNEILEGGQPGSINRKMNLGADSVPIQNQAASQKLLKKMSDKGRERGEFKHGRSGKFRGNREETALLTLDEWEVQKGKMKATSSSWSDDVSQDAELARQLQNQLDLEASNEKMAHEQEAEKIRMSIFNFGNTSNNSENRGRKPRGRGRGNRRF